jgi:hypothetical protein
MPRDHRTCSLNCYCCSSKTRPFIDCLINASVEDSLGEDLLGDLGSHISIRELGSNENSTNFLLFGVDLVYFHLDTSSGDIEGLVVLLEELIITILSGLKTGECDSHVVTGGSTTSLGVEEETSTVRRSVEVSSHLETRLEGSSVTLGNKILHGKEERNTFASRKLNSSGGVVNSILFGEDDVSSGGFKLSLNSIKSVSLTSHDLGLDKLLLSLSGLADFFLNSPSLGLDAHVDETGSSLGDDRSLTDDLRASVGKTSSLDLQVREFVDLALGKGVSRSGGSGEADGKRSGNSDLSGVGKVGLQGHLKS